jgi:hypothetical protein
MFSGGSLSTPSTPVTESLLQFEDQSEWAFLPAHSSGLATAKWGGAILEGLAKRVGEFVSWGEEGADSVRIAVGGIRERIVRAVLVSWREGTPSK